MAATENHTQSASIKVTVTLQKPHTSTESALKEERNRVLNALTEQKEIIKKLVSDRATFFQDLVSETNTVSEKFVQFKVWRNRYGNSDSSSGNANPYNFIVAFTEVDRQVQLLSQIFITFDARLIQAAELLHEYFRFMDVQFTWLHDNINFAATATSMKQLKTVWTPKEDWVETFPKPKLEDLADKWKNLQLQSKLTQCFRHMEAIIRLIASNGDL